MSFSEYFQKADNYIDKNIEETRFQIILIVALVLWGSFVNVSNPIPEIINLIASFYLVFKFLKKKNIEYTIVKKILTLVFSTLYLAFAFWRYKKTPSRG